MANKLMGKVHDNGLHVRLAASVHFHDVERERWDLVAGKRRVVVETVQDTVYSVEWSHDGKAWRHYREHNNMRAGIVDYREVSMALGHMRGNVVAAADKHFPDMYTARDNERRDASDTPEQLFDVVERDSVPFVGKEEHVLRASVPLPEAQLAADAAVWSHKKFADKPARRRDYWTISIEQAQ